MSVLTANFNKKVNQFSPVMTEITRVVKYDEDGAELVTYEPLDLKKVQAEQGSVDMWQINNLRKAGINPRDLTPHTGYASRIDGASAIGSVEADLENFAAAAANNNVEKNED